MKYEYNFILCLPQILSFPAADIEDSLKVRSRDSVKIWDKTKRQLCPNNIQFIFTVSSSWIISICRYNVDFWHSFLFARVTVAVSQDAGVPIAGSVPLVPLVSSVVPTASAVATIVPSVLSPVVPVPAAVASVAGTGVALTIAGVLVLVPGP